MNEIFKLIPNTPTKPLQVVPVPKQHKRVVREALFATAIEYNLSFNEIPLFSQLQQVFTLSYII